MAPESPFGLLNVDKPPGLTSRDAVNRVQRMIRPAKIGHAGTLDPLATGVLVLGLGPATRLVEYVQRMKKVYRGTFLLGRTSDTEDIQGQVVELRDAPRPSRHQIADALPPLTGVIQQMPPAFSALKIRGRRAYDLARRGQTVDLQPRSVHVYAIRLLAYDYPELQLEITCGSGTYIRSLGRDLARSLGTGAVMSGLQRTAIGPFRVEDACPLDALTDQTLADRLLAPRLAIADLPTIELADDQIRRILHGQTIENDWQCSGEEIAALDRSGHLIAILTPRHRGELKPVKNFARL